MMQSEHTAPCPTTSLSLPALLWDTRPEISESELAALDTLVDHFQQGGKNWSPDIQKRLSRLLLPLRDTLTKMHAAKAPYNSSIHDIVLEMQRIRKTYWAWTQEEWLEVICNSEGEFRRRFGARGNCRQYVIALAWLLCGFERLEHCGIFYQYRLCLKVFGRQSTDFAVSQLDNMMQVLGYVNRPGFPGEYFISCGSFRAGAHCVGRRVSLCRSRGRRLSGLSSAVPAAVVRRTPPSGKNTPSDGVSPPASVPRKPFRPYRDSRPCRTSPTRASSAWGSGPAPVRA